ncbi:MAG: hypothetical protein HY225_01520 [Candidatus Vogelbacteria bacterium]|nr:hypothetical protein [Candidatus Vogelbacteria bacterium]
MDNKKIWEYNYCVKKQKKEYLEVLADDMNGKFDILIDGQKMLSDKLDEHTEILNRHSEILSSHSEILSNHSEILSSHSEKLDSHTEMIGSIKTDVEIIKEDVAFLKNGIKRKVDAEEFSALERRVILLEKKLARSHS